MTPTKSSNSTPGASPRIACYGTAFLADHPIDEKLLMRGLITDVPQLSSPQLDASFLINCGRLLSGNVTTTETPSTYVKRIAGSDFRSPKAVVLYECSTELRELLADLTAKRAAEMTTDWYSMYGPNTKAAQPNGRTQIRLAILKSLAAIASQAQNENKTLMLRVDYRNIANLY